MPLLIIAIIIIYCGHPHRLLRLTLTPSLPCCPHAESCSFKQWLGSRPDLQAAFGAIQENPGAALTPVPVAREPALYQVWFVWSLSWS